MYCINNQDTGLCLSVLKIKEDKSIQAIASLGYKIYSSAFKKGKVKLNFIIYQIEIDVLSKEAI